MDECDIIRVAWIIETVYFLMCHTQCNIPFYHMHISSTFSHYRANL